MDRLEIPIITLDTIKAMEDTTFFTHALIFDDLLIISQNETNCFVLKSTDGLIVIDAIWPKEEVFNAIVTAINDVGWNPYDIKKLVITHGHVDHTGCGKWIVDAFHPTTYLSKSDDLYWENEPVKKNRPETWKDYMIDLYVKEGDIIELGDKKLYVYSTPGHTPGGLSFIFNVHDDGQEYMAALWGGSTPPNRMNEIVQYLKSLDHFVGVCEENKVVIALSNHVSLDMGHERIEYSRKRMSYMPNIYIIGEAGFRKYCQLFRNLCYEKILRISENLNK